MDPCGVRHVLVHHLDDPECRRLAIKPKPLPHIARNRNLGLLDRQLDLASREVVGVQLAQHQVRVCDRRPRAAPLIACRSGLRASALGTRLNSPHRIDPGQRPASGPDLDHLDHGDRDRHPRPLREAIGPRHLESARGLGLKIFDQTNLGRRAAHVVADDLLQPEPPRHVGGKDRARRRPRLDQPHRKGAGGFDRDQPPARMNHEDRTIRPHLPQPVLKPRQIALHPGPHIGVRADRVEPLELAHLRTDLRRDRDGDVQLGGQNLAGALLVCRVHVGMDEADRDRPEPLVPDMAGQPLQFGFVQCRQFLPLRADPACDRESILARDQWLGQPDVQVVLRKPVLGPHLDHVAEAFRRHQRRPRAPPLDQRIGGQRRAVDDDADLRRRNTGDVGHDGNPVQDCLFGRCIVRQHLGRE